MNQKWEVQTYVLTDGWSNIWMHGGEKLYFNSKTEAYVAIDSEIRMRKYAYNNQVGDEFDKANAYKDYRIVPL